MELLVWHEALGCDDEQASEPELLARVLYAYSTSSSSSSSSSGRGDGGASACLQTLHFAQGLLAFVQMLKRSDRDQRGDATAAEQPKEGNAHKRLEWVSVTLSKRRFFVQEVEPQVYIALKEHRFVYKALMRDLYGLFCLFHGRIESNLRRLPEAPAPRHTVTPGNQRFRDGMELLFAIQATRKRIRKLGIAIESWQQSSADDHVHEAAQDNTLSRLEGDLASSQVELEELLEVSPVKQLEKRFAELFPALLRALDASHASSLHELIGMGQFPVDQPTFLSLQSFLNAFSLELSDKVESSAIFFKGNLVWSSMEASTLQLLYRFLRLREENGMEVELTASGELSQKTNSGRQQIWMAEKYRDTFLPIWSSKSSYAECTIVNHARRHPRKAVRSLHKQTASPLAAVVTDANGNPHSSSSNSSKAHSPSEGGGDPSTVHTLSKSALKARIKSVSYRNTGLLMKNGYFAKTFELPIKSRGRGKFSESEAVDFIWMPRIFSEQSGVGSTSDGDSQRAPESKQQQPQEGRYAVLWHESDLSMVILVKASKEDASLVLSTLGCIEDTMDRLKFHELAKLILSQSSRGSSSSTYPFVYLNRANGTFKARQIPRLIKSKEDDLFPPPLRLLANYLPQQTLDLLNFLHCELQKCGYGETRDACVKTLHDGWVLGKKSHMTQREFFAFFDTKVPSVADLSGVYVAF